MSTTKPSVAPIAMAATDPRGRGVAAGGTGLATERGRGVIRGDGAVMAQEGRSGRDRVSNARYGTREMAGSPRRRGSVRGDVCATCEDSKERAAVCGVRAGVDDLDTV